MTDFEIFQRCFPEYRLTESLFATLTGQANCTIFRQEGGVAYVRGENIVFLAVLPQMQGQGIGTALLARCEAHIRETGGKEATICGIFPGIPAGSAGFFHKKGYETNESFVEMGMDIHGYKQHVCPIPEQVEFRFYDGDMAALRRIVAIVDEEWPQYFTGDSPVLCGYVDGQLASFCMVDEDVDCLMCTGRNRVGSIGCVGTHPDFRKRGIGLAMVECATELLAHRGMDEGFIHYTHLEGWYGKLGYRTFLRFLPGTKALT